MYEFFEKLMQKKDVNHSDVSKATGISQSSLSDWKSGRYTPKADKLKKIADYFGVSVEYLMTGKEEGKDSYYLDNDAKELSQFLFQNPEYRVLFDASRKVKKKDIQFVKEFIDRMTSEYFF